MLILCMVCKRKIQSVLKFSALFATLCLGVVVLISFLALNNPFIYSHKTGWIIGYEIPIEDYRSLDKFEKMKCGFCGGISTCKDRLATYTARTIANADGVPGTFSKLSDNVVLTTSLRFLASENLLANIAFTNARYKTVKGLKNLCHHQYSKECSSLSDEEIIRVSAVLFSEDANSAQLSQLNKDCHFDQIY